jgi:hypothetical protein
MSNCLICGTDVKGVNINDVAQNYIILDGIMYFTCHVCIKKYLFSYVAILKNGSREQRDGVRRLMLKVANDNSVRFEGEMFANAVVQI